METRFMVLPETQAVVVGEGSRTIRGYGIVFNRESEPLWAGGRTFREVILPEAVQGVDLRSMLSMHNHKSDRLLGNTRSGTMRVGVDSVGVWYETDLPDSPTGQDVLVSVSRRDTQGSSFQFDIKDGGDRWSIKNGMAFREVTKFNGVYEMGPVSEPAYPDTTIAKASLRSLEALTGIEGVQDKLPALQKIFNDAKRDIEAILDNPILEETPIAEDVVNEITETDFQAIADDDFAFQQKQLLI